MAIWIFIFAILLLLAIALQCVICIMQEKKEDERLGDDK